MNEVTVNQGVGSSIAVVKTDSSGQKVIQKKQRVKILQNMLAMKDKHNLSFNRLLCLEARFHGLPKQDLADQLYEVCEGLKGDSDDIFVQGLENLQKALVGPPLRKMKPNAFGTSEKELQSHSNPNKVSSPMKGLMEPNSGSNKSNDCKSAFSSSSSSKNGGRKRKAKEHRKRVLPEVAGSKMARLSSPSAEAEAKFGTPECLKKPEGSPSLSPFHDLFKSKKITEVDQKDPERQANPDTVMADVTTSSVPPNLVPRNWMSANLDARIHQENETLKQQLEEQKTLIKQLQEGQDEKQREIDRLKYFIERIENDREPLERELESSEAKISKLKQTLAKYLRMLQEISNKEKRTMIASKSVKIGQMIHKRIGEHFKQVWEDGDEIIELKNQLQEIRKERESLEKLKRSKKTRKMIEQATNSGSSDDKAEVDNLFDIDNGFELTQSLFKIEECEQKEFLAFKIQMKQKEEAKIRERLEQIKKEKVILANEMKRQNEELNSTLCGKKATEKFRILNDKYLILSLLGKGGYSEVYKAYDLENCREVACKIHRFDETWSRSMQANYIKHALRENETHQKLSHPRIVKHYDTIEIDNNSFCTVLELCSGPDLAEYMKINGCIPEKEAKLIITQILSGLKYLSDHEPKIIHYDLKPQNILFHNGEIKISDFGLCKVVEDSSERVELTSQGVGTYWYQPPECFEVGPNPPLICSKVDIWALGVIYFEMLYGVKPFGHEMSQQRILESRAILKTSKSVKFPVKPNVTAECKEFIKKCLAYFVTDRLSVEEAYNNEFIRPKK